MPRARVLLALLWCCSIPSLAHAQTYRLLYPRAVFYLIGNDGSVADRPSLAPADVLFEITDRSDARYLVVTFKAVPTISAAEVSAQAKALAPPGELAALLNDSSPVVRAAKDDPVRPKREYRVARTDLLPRLYRLERGVDVGALAIPFKFQLSNGDLTAGGSLGPYVGYRQRWLFVPSSILISLGATAVPTVAPSLPTDPQPGNIKSVFGVSASAGVVLEIVNNFQAGLLFGIDHASDKSYAYQDKGWISFSIGYGFLHP